MVARPPCSSLLTGLMIEELEAAHRWVALQRPQGQSSKLTSLSSVITALISLPRAIVAATPQWLFNPGNPLSRPAFVPPLTATLPKYNTQTSADFNPMDQVFLETPYISI